MGWGLKFDPLSLVKSVGDTATGLFQTVTSGVSGAAEAVTSAVTDVVDHASEVVTSVTTTVTDAADSVVETVTDVVDKAKDATEVIMHPGKSFIKAIADFIKKAIQWIRERFA